jgi:hypothetical protein
MINREKKVVRNRDRNFKIPLSIVENAIYKSYYTKYYGKNYF